MILEISRLPTMYVVGALVVCAVLLWRRYTQVGGSRPFPIVPKSYGNRRDQYFAWLSGNMLKDGYKSFQHDIHTIPTPEGDHVIIPQRYLNELKNRPDEELDFISAFLAIFVDSYTAMDPGRVNLNIMTSAVKMDLASNLGNMNDDLAKAVGEAVAAQLPLEADVWTPVHVHTALRTIVARASGHILVGPDLCKNDEYLRIAVNFTVDLFSAIYSVLAWPQVFRPLIGRIAPPVRRVWGNKRDMARIIGPAIEARRAAQRRGEKLPMNVLQWMVDRCDKAGTFDVECLSQMVLLLVLAAAHTITLAVTLILYTLADNPDVLERCREEIQAVLKESNGVFDSRALFNMKFLDSVMRECQRVTPPSVEAFRRVAMKDVTLKDGTVIPAGSFVETPVREPLYDSDLYASPERFDPARFYRLRTDPDEPDPLNLENREQYQYASATKENLSFGYGRHVCPGRFLASNHIKMLLAHILLRYDIKPDGKPIDRSPRTKFAEISIATDLSRGLLFKPRATA